MVDEYHMMNIIIHPSIIKMIVSRISTPGMRDIKRDIELIFGEINLMRLMGEPDSDITEEFVMKLLKRNKRKCELPDHISHMYM